MREKDQVLSLNNWRINSDLLISKGSKNWLLAVSPACVSTILLALTFPTAQQSHWRRPSSRNVWGNYLGVLEGILLQKVSTLSAKSVRLPALLLKWCVGKSDVWYFHAESLPPVLKLNWALVITCWAENSRFGWSEGTNTKSCCTHLPLP